MTDSRTTIAFVMKYHFTNKKGGAETQTDILSRELSKNNFDVYYIAETKDKKKFNVIENYHGVKILWINSRHLLPYNSRYYRSLIKINPKIIITRHTSALTFITGKYCKNYKKKFIWMCHDDMVPFDNYFMRFLKVQLSISSNSLIKKIISYPRAWLKDYYKNKGLKYVNKAFTQNQFQKDTLYKNYGIKSEILNSSNYKATIQYKQKQQKNIIWLGSISSRKRPDLFIRLAKKCEDTDLSFIMIGNCSSKKKYNYFFKDIPSNLKWLGKKDYNESMKYLSDSFVLINTSIKNTEGFPNTYIEAWFRGVPTLTMDCDPDNIIENFRLGYAKNDLKLIKKKIMDFRKDEALYKKYHERVIEYANKNHSINKNIKKFINKIT